ncbi:MAG: sensor histidine kinase [Dehalococcoidales bacterium]|nr:sensor histidine kinase [Dehalococcoidales bacterium]
MFGKYEKEAYRFLAVYRFLAYALAVMFSQVDTSPFITTIMSEEQMYIILGILGVYTVLRVFSPLRWRERGLMTYLILLGDFIICIALVVYTNGLNSIFLLYSLAPVMTAALFFEERVAISLAAIAITILSVTHVALSQLAERWTWIFQGYNLTLLVVYAMFSLVAAIVPYRINMNIRRRIEQEAIIEERRRIAREIHDGVAQSIGYLNTKTKLISKSVAEKDNTEIINELNELQEVIQETYTDIRESIDQLSVEIRNIPLIAALENYIEDFRGSNNLKVIFDHPKLFPRLSPVAELQLLRITQESLTNVRRHSGATGVEIILETDNDTVDMLIKDNGCGFSLNEIEDSIPGYHGLDIIRERAENIGGEVHISTEPGEGTALMIVMPLDKVRL